MIRTILILPGSVLVLIPGLILFATRGSVTEWFTVRGSPIALLCAALISIPGLVLSVWTSRLFLTKGDGTPAPWDPPKNLVILGPYRYVRNPMISGVLCLLVAESLLFASMELLGWTIAFMVFNTIYFYYFEERQLERRFGAEYVEYKRHVRRWNPRLSAWSPAEASGGGRTKKESHE